MEDGTFEILAGLNKKSDASMSFLTPPEYNIDEMDGRTCMISLDYTGCFCIASSRPIDPKKPGMIYIDGAKTREPLIKSPMLMFGQLVGIFVRRYLTEYNRSYEITYRGAFDMDGLEIPEFTFILKTMPRINPGEKYPQHDQIVLDAAREGAVLLKNEQHTLPLKSGCTVNVFGLGCVVYRLGCLGAGKINPRYGIGVREGIEKYSSLKLNQELYDFYTTETNDFPPEVIVEHARALSDTAVVFITRGSSEAHDMPKGKGGYMLSDSEFDLLSKVRKNFNKMAVILNTAYPIEMSWADTLHVDTVLWTGLCGMAGGRALAEILDGTVCPSGKLPNTWAYKYEDYPSAANFLSMEDIREQYKDVPIQYITTVYEEGIYVGYRYFDTFKKPAAYMFGHGLSYTTFKKTLIKSDQLNTGCGVMFSIAVENTGTCSGKEVVMLYAALPQGKLEQPSKRLVAFGKTKLLQPGEKEILQLGIADLYDACGKNKNCCPGEKSSDTADTIKGAFC